MATTIDRAKAKLAAKIPGMPGNYNRSMESFFGRNISSSVPAASYAAKVRPGMEDIWEANLRRSFGL